MIYSPWGLAYGPGRRDPIHRGPSNAKLLQGNNLEPSSSLLCVTQRLLSPQPLSHLLVPQDPLISACVASLSGPGWEGGRCCQSEEEGHSLIAALCIFPGWRGEASQVVLSFACQRETSKLKIRVKRVLTPAR